MAKKDVRPKPKNSNVFHRFGDHIRNKTVSGLFQLLPMLVTIVVVVVLAGYADNAAKPIISLAAGDTKLVMGNYTLEIGDIPGLGLVVVILVFYLVGLLTSTRLGSRAMATVTDLISYIPVIKGIFNVTRQATTALTAQFAFSRVVFLEWPREGMIAMGFVTAEIVPEEEEDSPSPLAPLAVVYIPTVPNPTSGNMALVPTADLLETDLSVDDAMKLVFSGGIVPPEVFSLARLPEEFREESRFTGRFKTLVEKRE